MDSAMARSLLTVGRKQSRVLTEKRSGEVDGISPPLAQMFIAIQRLRRLVTLFTPEQAYLMPGHSCTKDLRNICLNCQRLVGDSLIFAPHKQTLGERA